jgi:glycosyltransferase involved in cell wall biosynthesis
VRITFVIPFLNPTGGIRVVLDYANALHRLGHRVQVVHPLWPYRFHHSRPRQLRVFARHLLTGNRLGWFDLEAPLAQVPRIADAHLPEADMVVATAWPTAYDVARLEATKGRKIYFIQLYEIDSGPVDQVDGSYRLPLAPVAVSSHLAELIEARFGRRCLEVIPPGVDPAVFYAGGRAEPLTVVMPYHPDARKGGEDGLAALRLLKERLPGLKVRLFGHRRPTDFDGVWMSFERQPTAGRLRALYAESAALLYPSRFEGFGLPPLEAMRCGCAVVTTRVGELPRLLSDGCDALLVPPQDGAAMARCLERVLVDEALRAALVACALERSQGFLLERGVQRWLAVLEKPTGDPG